MRFPNRLTQKAELPHDEAIEELRRQTLRAGAYFALISGVILDLALATFTTWPRETWLVTAGLILTSLLSIWIIDRSASSAAALLAVGLSLSLVGAIRLFPDTPLPCLLSILVLIFGSVSGWRLILSVALGASVLVGLLARFPGYSISSEVVVVSILLIWVSAILAWLASQPVQAALHWSWQNYIRAQEVAEESRARQGELGRLSKSLNETCDRLELLSQELERARQAAENARKAKADFAAAVSHELRTPLNMIIGFSEMMVLSPRSSYEHPLPEAYREDIKTIYRNAGHISGLIDDILDLSQIDAQRMALVKEHADLAEILHQALDTIAPRIESQGLHLHVDIPEGLPSLYIDPARIRQIIINLVFNALRFTDEGGITVSALRRQGEVVVSVADTGVGIPTEDLPHVFEEFRQSVHPGSRRGGSGLGLTVSKRFVEMHGGSMWAESRLGEGSTFFFSLPLLEDPITSPYTSRPARLTPNGTKNSANRTLLVLDEGGQMARVIERYLDDYRVIRATSVDQVLRHIKERRARAILVNSAELQEQLSKLLHARGSLFHLPIVTCPFDLAHHLSQELGVTNYLVKPITRERLRVALRTLPKRPRSVLVTDDDEEMAQLLARMTRSCLRGCQVWIAHDGEECLEELRSQAPDLLLLDLLMPKVDGYQVLDQIRGNERLRKTSVISVTAKSNEDEMVTARTLAISRPGGLLVGDTMRCLKGSLDALLNPGDDTDGGHRGGWFE